MFYVSRSRILLVVRSQSFQHQVEGIRFSNSKIVDRSCLKLGYFKNGLKFQIEKAENLTAGWQVGEILQVTLSNISREGEFGTFYKWTLSNFSWEGGFGKIQGNVLGRLAN